MKKRVLSLLMTFALCLGLSVMAGAEEPNVAEVTIGDTTTQYTDIKAAFAAAQDTWSPATVTLLTDVTLNGTGDNGTGIGIGGFNNITLNLNGKTVNQQELSSFSGAYDSVFCVLGTLTVIDSAGSGKIVQPNAGPAVTAFDNGGNMSGTLVIKGGTIETTSSTDSSNIPNCAVYVQGGSVEIKGGTVKGSKIGVAVDSGELTVTGEPQIHGEGSNALLVKGGTVTLSGGTYTTNEPDNHSIWNISGKAEDLLVNGYRFENNGSKSEYSGDGKGVVGNTTVAVRPKDEVFYIDADGKETMHEGCTELTAAGFTGAAASTETWFAANTSFTADEPFEVLGTVNLILCDNVTVALNKGISLHGSDNQPATLNIYAQNGGTGKLICSGGSDSGCAGIYDSSNSDGYKTVLNIYGGVITATGTSKMGAPDDPYLYGASIGMKANYQSTSTMEVNISGGTVTAKSGGKGAQAIGSGTNSKGTVTVKIAPGLKCVETDDQNTVCAYDNKDGTSVTITKCEEHVWGYENNDNNTHTKTCKLCGADGATESHTYENWTPDVSDNTKHIGTCVCGAEKSEAHTLRPVPNDDGLTHSSKCGACGYTAAAAAHSYPEKEDGGYEQCACGAKLAAEYDGEKYASLQAAVNAAKADGTVTLARDVAENVTVADGAVTVDLNGNKWWADISENPDKWGRIPLIVTGGSVTLKNGTLDQGRTSSAGSYGIRIQGGSVTVKGDAVVIGSNTTGSAANISYPAIRLEDGELILETGAALVHGLEVTVEGKTLSDYLPAGTAFGLRSYDGTNGTWTAGEDLLNAYTTNVYHVPNMALVVVKHTKHAFTPNGEGKYVCACGYVCTHSGGIDTTTGNCVTCGQSLAVASVAASDGTAYYKDIQAAFDAAKVSGGGTLTLLQDVTLPENENISITTPVGTGEYNFTVDWKGHTLSGNTWQNLLSFSDRTNVTLKDSGGSNAGGVRNTYNTGGIAICVSTLGGYRVTIEGGTYSARVWKSNCSGDLKIRGGVFENPANSNVSYALCSEWRGESDGSLADMLVPGFTFAYDADGKDLLNVYTTAHTEAGKTVYVVAHGTHTIGADNKCACGYVCPHAEVNEGNICTACGKAMAATVTKGDESHAYVTLADALTKAAEKSGSTLKLLTNAESIDVSNIQNIFYLDLNGKTINTLTVSGSETPRLLDNAENKGSIGKLTYNSGILASLLRGGWGFKSGDGWLKADALFGASADNVSVAETRITGVGAGGGGTISYGSTATVTATANPNGLTGLSYQWYERISGKWEAVSNATESSYSSSTLSLGDHYFTCAVTDGDGAVVLSGVASVQVDRASIAGANITPQANSGNTYNPADNRLVVVPKSSTELVNAFGNVTYQFEVTYNGNKLTLGTDYTIKDESNIASNAGKHELTIVGTGNYAGEKTVEWTIESYELSGKHLPTQINKPYDGTTEGENITQGKEALGIFEIDSSNTRNPKVDTTFLPQIELYNCFTLSDMHFDSAEAGERTFTFTIELKTDNFVFAGGNKTAKISLVRAGSTAVSISKATASTDVSHRALTVYNQTKRTYEVDLAGLLPELGDSKTYGTVGGTEVEVKLSEGYYTNGAEIKDGKLLLPIESVSSTKTEKIGTVTVTVTTTNYQPITLTIDVSAANQPASGGGGGGSTTTNTETTTNPDGSTTKTETKSDGTVVETTTNPDGSVSKTESKTTTKSDGSTVETVTETNTGADGSKSTSKTETTTAKDGSKTETKSETKTEADGTKSETKSETKTDANGVTSGKETTKTTAPNGSTGTTTTTTENGNTKTEAEAKISSKAVEDAKKSGEAVKVPTEVKSGEDSSSAPTVKIELPKNAGETKIEIPVSDANSGTVAVIVHPDGTEEIVKDSKPTEDGVQLTVDGSATVKIIDNTKTFDDTRDHWSRDEVNFVASREIFNGVGGNSFGVNQPMTRGMVNTVLARLAGIDTTPKNGQKWYEVGTAWAKQNGITDGTNPEASVTREQLATLLYRFSGTPEVNGALSFSDAHEVSDYAQSALLWATQNGILNGVGSERIAPGADAQRAQVAAMMARYLKNAG